MRGVPAEFRDDGAMSARPPRTPPRAVGGSTDPQSAFVADVEAVQRAAVAYRRHAEEMGRHGPALHVLGLQVLDAAAASGTRRARPADAWSLWRVARRLSAHAEARGDLARRAHLHERPPAHHGDLISEGQRLLVVVGHQHGGHAAGAENVRDR